MFNIAAEFVDIAKISATLFNIKNIKRFSDFCSYIDVEFLKQLPEF